MERKINGASPTTTLHVEPTVAANPANLNNLVAAYIEYNGAVNPNTYDCISYRSTDLGNTWNTRVQINAADRNVVELCFDPVIRFSPAGNAYATYLATYKSLIGVQHYTINARYSFDQGQTWSFHGINPGVLDVGGVFCGNTLLDEPWIAVDPVNFRLYVAFLELDVTGNNCEIYNYRMRVATTTDLYGTHNQWSFVDVTSSPNTLNGANIAVAPNGDVLLAWYDSQGVNGGSGTVAEKFARSTNHGASFSAPVTIATPYSTANQLCSLWNIFGTMDPKLAVGTNPSNPTSYNAYVVYGARPQLGAQGCNTDMIDIYYTKSSDQGNTWSTPLDLTLGGLGNNPDQFYPSIAIDSDNELHVTYADMGVNNLNTYQYQTMHLYSRDQGVTWIGPIAVASVAASSNAKFEGDYYDIATSGQRIIPIWTDQRNGGDDIYAAVSYQSPSPPQYLKATSVTASSVQISWTPPGLLGIPSTANYKIYRALYPGQETLYTTVPVSTTSFTDNSVNSGTIYYYYVTAISSADIDGTLRESTISNELGVYVPSPSSSSPCTATASPTSGRLSVTVSFSVSCPAGVNGPLTTWHFNDPNDPYAMGVGQTASHTYSWTIGGASYQYFNPTVIVTDNGSPPVSSSPGVPVITVYCTRTCPTSPSP